PVFSCGNFVAKFRRGTSFHYCGKESLAFDGIPYFTPFLAVAILSPNFGVGRAFIIVAKNR
ncbi:hypothetical protein ACNQT2_11685, partial [Corynebacterium diphtheriae]